MKKNLILAIIMTALFAGGCLVFAYLLKAGQDRNTKKEEFNIVYKFCGDTFDTSSGKYTKFMDFNEPDAVADLNITREEKEVLRQKIRDLDLLNKNPQNPDNSSKTPCCNIYLEVNEGNNVTKRSWNDCGRVSDSYIEFEKSIFELLNSKPGYKSLPPVKHPML